MGKLGAQENYDIKHCSYSPPSAPDGPHKIRMTYRSKAQSQQLRKDVAEIRCNELLNKYAYGWAEPTFEVATPKQFKFSSTTYYY